MIGVFVLCIFMDSIQHPVDERNRLIAGKLASQLQRFIEVASERQTAQHLVLNVRGGQSEAAVKKRGHIPSFRACPRI